MLRAAGTKFFVKKGSCGHYKEQGLFEAWY